MTQVDGRGRAGVFPLFMIPRPGGFPLFMIPRGGGLQHPPEFSVLDTGGAQSDEYLFIWLGYSFP